MVDAVLRHGCWRLLPQRLPRFPNTWLRKEAALGSAVHSLIKGIPLAQVAEGATTTGKRFPS